MKKPVRTNVTFKVPKGKKLIDHGDVVLQEDTIVGGAVITYLLIALGTFGSLAASYDQSLCCTVQTSAYLCDGSGICEQRPATSSRDDCKSWDLILGRFLPLVGGVVWPVYWPLHLAVKVFS